MSSRAIGYPHLDVLTVRADALQLALVGEFAGEELDGRIVLAGGPEPVEFGEALHAEFTQGNFGIEPERRLEIFRFEQASGEVVQALAKRVEVERRDAQPGGHRVATVTQQQIAAVAQRRREIKTGNAPT